jgi:hypothetical protein
MLCSTPAQVHRRGHGQLARSSHLELSLRANEHHEPPNAPESTATPIVPHPSTNIVREGGADMARAKLVW